jgi:hypothetical protein
MRLTKPIVAILALVALATSGCAKPPTEQIEAAERAVKEAQQSGAATYTAEDYAKLEGNLAALKKEVADQDGKFALFRDYGKAEQLAASVKADGERVQSEAAKKKEEAKAAALQAQQVAQEAVRSTLDLVAKAPVGKDRAALEAIKAEAEALNSLLNQVQGVIEKEDYQAAQTQAKAIQEKSRAISSEIEQALAKVGKRKPSADKKK